MKSKILQKLFFIGILLTEELAAQTITPLIALNIPNSPSLSSGALQHKSYVFKNHLYFIAETSGEGALSLIKSDGTVSGTALLKNINPTSTAFPKAENEFVPATFEAAATNDFLFFMASQYGTAPWSLWRTDGTETGTIKLPPSTSSNFSSQNKLVNSVVANNMLFFTIYSDGKRSLWRSDGTVGGTILLASGVFEAFTSDQSLVVFKNKVFFLGTGSTETIASLFETDGTVNGTKLVKKTDIDKSQGLVGFTNSANSYFVFNSGRKLWRSDGTDTGTYSLKTFSENLASADGVLYLKSFAGVGGNIIFQSYNSTINKHNLWKTDGTIAGTQIIRSDVSIQQSVVLNNKLLFIPSPSAELWQTDGTSSGTVLVKQLPERQGNYDKQILIKNPSFFVHQNAAYFFRSNSIPQLQANRYFLYRTDGTTNGTEIITDSLMAYTNLVALKNNELYFSDWNYIYRTDGTRAGLTKIIRLPGTSDDLRTTVGTIDNLSVLSGKIYFPYYADFSGVSNRYQVFDPTAKPTSCKANLRLSNFRYESANQSQWDLCAYPPQQPQRLIATAVEIGASTFQWQRNGIDIVGATRDSYLASETGAYKIKISVNGCSFTTSVQNLRFDKPKTELRMTELLGPTTTYVLDVFNSGGYADNQNLYQSAELWFNGQPLTNGIPQVTNQYGRNVYNPKQNEKGLYTHILIDIKGCTDTTSYNFGGLQVKIFGSSSTVCEGSTATLTATVSDGTAPYSYQWKLGTSSIGTNTNTLIANTAGNYSVTVTDSKGVTTNSNFTITAGKFEATISGGNSLCSGTNLTLTANATCGTAPYTYQWKNSMANTGSNTNTLAVSAAGVYSVVVTDAKGVVVTSSSITVTPKTAPTIPTVSASATGFVMGERVTLTATVGTGLSVQWLRDGMVITGATQSTYTASEAGSYSVRVSNTEGCSATSAVVVLSIILANTLQNEVIGLQIAPNPVGNQAKIVLKLAQPVSANVYLTDASGKRVRAWESAGKAARHEVVFEIRLLTAGSYMLQAEADGQVFVQKLVKE
ncbi:MAG TPA: hypothetical protein DCM71_18050 [Runella sp.]|nr:hypothetical protein [Runella sp.]